MSHFSRKLILSLLFLPVFHLSSQTEPVEGTPRSVQTTTKPLFPSGLGPMDPKWQIDLIQRMQASNIPGVSFAVKNKGIAPVAMSFGSTGYGPDAKSVNPRTLFQAASISKSLTAFGIMILVQQGKLSLDKDVNDYLISWKLPDNDFTKDNKVTLRKLLSHTAGTSVWGFPGYHVGAILPALNQVLDGINPPANTPEIRVIMPPGKAQQYSGGGTTIVQKIIEDTTGEPFDKWMKNNVLIPLGMIESTFDTLTDPKTAPMAAFGHYRDGKRVDGNWHLYPEKAAAGLWTTPSDLLKFIGYIQTAQRVKTLLPLRTEFIKMMLTQQTAGNALTSTGLGFFVAQEGNSFRFYHDGLNEGFGATYFGYLGSDFGIAIMSNSDSAGDLINKIGADLTQFLKGTY